MSGTGCVGERYRAETPRTSDGRTGYLHLVVEVRQLLRVCALAHTWEVATRILFVSKSALHKAGIRKHRIVAKRNPALTEADRGAFARSAQAAYKVSKRVVFVNDRPTMPVGKVLPRQLRNQWVNWI